MKLICERCGMEIAEFDPDQVRMPVSGEMFRAKGLGYHAPWPAGQDWEHMFCPYDAGTVNRHRIWAWHPETARQRVDGPDYLITDKGRWEIGGRLPGRDAPRRPVYSDAELAEEWERRQALVGLDPKLAKMKELRAGGMSYAAIGKELGMTGEGVRKALLREDAD